MKPVGMNLYLVKYPVSFAQARSMPVDCHSQFHIVSIYSWYGSHTVFYTFGVFCSIARWILAHNIYAKGQSVRGVELARVYKVRMLIVL